MSDEPQITHMNFDASRGVTEIGAIMPSMMVIVEECTRLLEEHRAENYVQFDLIPRGQSGLPGYRVTVQRAEGKSPAQRVIELEAQNARFVERIAELVAAVALLEEAVEWEPVPDGEYPMVEDAEMDGDFLYITGNQDESVCTWVERPCEMIMLDLPMKIMRRKDKGGSDEA